MILKKFKPYFLLLLLYISLNFILRIVLVFHPITQSDFSVIEILKIFGFGFLNDVLVMLFPLIFLWLYLMFLSNKKFDKPYGYLIFGTLLALLIYCLSGRSILNEYGGSAPEIGISFVALKTFLFGLLLFLPKYRNKIRLFLYSFTIFIFVLLIIQNTLSEYFFWNEFGVRYNFIAVDYLVYTNEVIGNIMQSYPVVPIFMVLFLFTAFITFYIVKNTKEYLDNLPNFVEKIKLTAICSIFIGIGFFIIPQLIKTENASNIFTNELQANGLHKFFLAFTNAELDYFKFYKTLPNEVAFKVLKNQIPDLQKFTTERKITSAISENKKNVVLITIESYSAEFMKMYGNEQNITPFLDSLALKSLVFSNLYAVGNRTVRGLEAVTMCIPPTAGESVVKRADNKNKFTTGSVFLDKGYQVKYLYGGDSYFDNMKDFFTGNSYQIIDKSTFGKNEITFANIWGVCDEDMAKKAVKTMNTEYKANKPFFNHWMTVSNHRPFTFPDGKIDIAGNAKIREGGVKYTDYALNKFFQMAKTKPWYKNTIYVIIADHCASSSGKTELPLDKYRIPAMIFDPTKNGSICNKLMSQIDIMPTAFGLLNFSYTSKFFGENVLKNDYQPRALIATYQNLGLIKNNVLTIISPKQQVKQYALSVLKNAKLQDDFQIIYDQRLLAVPNTNLINETISYYQTASQLLKSKKYNAIK